MPRETRRRLTKLGLESYYRAKLRSYIDVDGSPDAFDNQFDKVDVRAVSDSWTDLDDQLKKLGIWNPTKVQEREEGLEQVMKEREIDRLYGEYRRRYEA